MSNLQVVLAAPAAGAAPAGPPVAAVADAGFLLQALRPSLISGHPAVGAPLQQNRTILDRLVSKSDLAHLLRIARRLAVSAGDALCER